MRSMSQPWARQARDLDRPQNEIAKDWISKSGRVRKLRDFSQDHSPGRDKGLASTSTSTSMSNSPVTTATYSAENSNDSERVGTVTVKMEPVSPVNGTPESETVKDNNSRVNLELLQKALTESVEEWFSYTEVVKSNKGKPYKKRKIVMPPLDESDFTFELTGTNDTTATNQEVGNERADSKSDQQPETSQAEEFRKSMALKITQNDKLRQLVVRMASRKINESQSNGSERRIEDIVKKERTEPAEEANTEMMGESSRTGERSENGNEKTTGNGVNRNYRHFFALILYGDKIEETESETRGSNSRQEPSSQQQGKTVIKTLNLETADLRDFEVELSDFNKLPKNSPMFECMSGIEKLLKTGASQSTVQKSVSAGSSNVAPNPDINKSKVSAGTSNMLPSRRRKMNEQVQECLVVLRKDIVENYKRKLERGMKDTGQEIGDKGENNETEARETVVDRVKDKIPKTNESADKEAEEEEINEPKEKVKAKDETEQKQPEMNVVVDTAVTKTKKATIKKQMDNEKDNGTSEMKLKKRKRFSPRKNVNLFSYVNNMKRKSGFKCSIESAEPQSVSNEEVTREPLETIQEIRVDEEKGKKSKQEAEVAETTERRMSRREIKLTPKLVHMIATSHKRSRKSPCLRENSVEEADYDYPNLINKVVSGSLTQEVAELSSSANPIENYLQSKMDANASSLECNWKPGDLVWARFAGNPFWPSLILRDPFSSDEFTKVRHLGRLPKTFVHLQFLSDSGRRAWVPEPYCMSFKGLDEFEKMKSKLPEITSVTKRNDILYQKAFFPTKKMEKAWLDAAKEGEALLSKSRDERITYMKIKYPLVKYAETVTNGHVGCNGNTVDESKKSQMGTRKRKTRSSSWLECSDWSNTEEGTTGGEPMSKTNESFECVTPTEAENNEGGDERASPKITLRLVRSTKKEEEKGWSKQEDTIGGRLAKRPKKDANVTTESASNSGLKPSVKNQNGIETSKGRRAKQVCQVCLKMVENKRVVKNEELCLGLVPNGAEVPSLKMGAGPGLKKRKRRRKFSSPPVNRWKQKLWAIFNFYKEFGGCKREGMDTKGLIELYHSLCRNRMGKRRRPTKLRRNK